MEKVVTLRCPLCHSLLLSARRVEIWHRDHETGKNRPGGQHVTVNRMSNIDIDRDMMRNPSQSKNAVRLEFNCAHCHGKPTLSISEVEDKTLLEFR